MLRVRRKNPRVTLSHNVAPREITKIEAMEKFESLFVGKTIVKTEFGFFRSEMCKDFTAGKECKFGQLCHYAHGVAEICPKPYDDFKFKVKQCTCQNRFTAAYKGIRFLDHCNYGSRCEWRHDEMVYVLQDDSRSSIISVYYSPEEDRYRISLKADPYESKIYVISLVRPVVHDSLFEDLRPYLEAAKRLVPPQNPCEYHNGLHTQSKCRIVGLETISTTLGQQQYAGGASTPPVFQPAPTPPVNHAFTPPMQTMLNFQPDQPYVFPASVLTPPSGMSPQVGYYPVYQQPAVPLMQQMQQQFVHAPLMTMPQFVPDETYVCYNPDSSMSDTFSWAQTDSQAGEDQNFEMAPLQARAPQQRGEIETLESVGGTPSPVQCMTPETSPQAGHTFLTTPTRISTAPPGYPERKNPNNVSLH